MKKLIPFLCTVSLIPGYAFAAGDDLNAVAEGIRTVISKAVPVLIGLALLVFLWGVFKYIWHGDDSSQREESKQFMIWGLVGLFVMVSVWGLVFILSNIFGFGVTAKLSPVLPAVQGK